MQQRQYQLIQGWEGEWVVCVRCWRGGAEWWGAGGWQGQGWAGRDIVGYLSPSFPASTHIYAEGASDVISSLKLMLLLWGSV